MVSLRKYALYIEQRYFQRLGLLHNDTAAELFFVEIARKSWDRALLGYVPAHSLVDSRSLS